MGLVAQSIAYAGEQPWWRGGSAEKGVDWKELTQRVNAKEMLVAAKMDFGVERTELFYKNKNGEFTELPGRFGVKRTDTGEAFEAVSVSNKYRPISYPEMFKTMDAVVDPNTLESIKAHYETAGILSGGATGWALARLDKEIFVADDAIRTYLLGTTSHDGSSSLRLKVVNGRVVCFNTFMGALGEHSGEVSWNIPHKGDVTAAMIEQARVILFAMAARQEAYKVWADDMLAIKVTREDWAKLLPILVPVPDIVQSIADGATVDGWSVDRANKVIARVNNRRQLIAKVAAQKPDLQNLNGTAYGMIQAVADAEQHMLGRGQTQKGGVTGKVDEKKLASLFTRSFETHELVDLTQAFIKDQVAVAVKA